jgi:hypothetical protein
MTIYGNLSLSDLIIYNNINDTWGSLTFNTSGKFAMSTGLDLTNGGLNVSVTSTQP